MIVNLGDQIKFDLFQIEEAQYVEAFARAVDGEVYSWKTTGKSNWLEKGYSCVDTLGIVVLPRDLPYTIDLPSDD